ncbi:hypothetical protein Q765_00270 [Flavobacterium rivuli WB 3.3-2 = DSM 21788]|uniref:Terminase large subunit gp17-like C-terminal domain-containing protein n=1 Tax=Flavobacterium rivuli WB 3.3-2 = DSM 21788 TaxID=1121895 RepID=A0A0A2MA95_9FLAO|nr:hypothetical protein [Flavobacterium rivuli]KGO88388.1 hypothetical protein Q765_00270 [Flavobacterium rivuli WB 3.3-2 = DSM 21788]
MAKKTDKAQLHNWTAFVDNTRRATPVDLNETPTDKAKRIKRLEANDEEWFKYYFPNFYTSEPAPFHKKATQRVMANPEWFEVRSWSRELAKSARTMMEVIKLTATGKKRNWLLVSNTYENACRLLLPYKIIFENNTRLINDYGDQVGSVKWEAGEFITKPGAAFRALGAGQSPRGSRNDNYRPDGILIDDIDTDEECRNPDRVTFKVDWIEQALIPTRSISVPLLIIVCGNIIAKYCCVTELAKKADVHDIVNIRDKNGKSTWPTKNTEEMIDRALKPIKLSSQQKEYYNNPIIIGKLFKSVAWGKCPKLTSCEQWLTYSDPATSDKKTKDSSTKGTGIIGYKAGKYYLYKIWLGSMTQSEFVKTIYDAKAYAIKNGADTCQTWLENNSLQDPFYQQVLKKLIAAIGVVRKLRLAISLDARKKGDKYDRLEATLEPLWRQGDLIFNEDEKDNPHMQLMEEQFLGVSPNSKFMDGPDLLEGGTWIIQNRVAKSENTYSYGKRQNYKY